MSDLPDEYICVGICMPDPDSGYCLGCGRPPLPAPGGFDIVVEELRPRHLPAEPLDEDQCGR